MFTKDTQMDSSYLKKKMEGYPDPIKCSYIKYLGFIELILNELKNVL